MYEAIIFLADGFEEIEAITTLDILRRGGVNAVSVSVTNTREVTGSHNICIQADITLDEMDDPRCAMLILPGGPGHTAITKHELLPELLKMHAARSWPIAAICAAPTILGELGILADKTAVCFPALEGKLKAAKLGEAPTVTDSNITTSKAAGTTVSFALEILRLIKGEAEAAKVAEAGLFA